MTSQQSELVKGEMGNMPTSEIKDSSPINILIVDDEPKNLTVLETVLNDPSYRLVKATSADEALLALLANEFALLILDIRMPGTTGFELANIIKERRKTARIPIIFLTAYYNEDQHVLEGYGTGAVDFLHKPVNPAILRSKVSVFAELHRNSRELGIAHRMLLAEVKERRQMADQLRSLNETLELRVRERTEALREQQLRLSQAADAARLTYVEVDLLRHEVRQAENFQAVMGYSSAAGGDAEFLSGNEFLLSHVAPQDFERVAGALKDFGARQRATKLDYRVLGDDKIERWIESEWFVEYGADGNPSRSFVTNLDISERKRAQEQLRESEERFRQLADSMPQVVWTARSDGSVDYYNARWFELVGVPSADFSDFASWTKIIHPEDAPGAVGAWKVSIAAGDPYRAEFRLWDRRLNRYNWYLGRAIALRDDLDRAAKWIGTCTDIDDHKRSEHDLRRANQALEQFAYAASHDLQEPLRNVSLYAQLLQESQGASLNEEGEDFVRVIIGGAQRMSRLVLDLLAFTNAANVDPKAATAVDAELVLQQVLKDLHLAIQESNATVTHDELPSVLMNEVHLQQLLQNLIGNALKYRREGEDPRVHVMAEELGKEVRFSIKDNGIGIDRQYQSQVFEVFRRLHEGSAKYSGTGMGLAICQRIVDQYGGRIWVESEPGNGAIFHFTIPASAAERSHD